MPKVIIFEDESFTRDMYSQKFLEVGFDVKSYEYPPTNFENEVIREKPDAIIMDIIMPNIDGFEAARRLKENPETKDIPIFALTNLDSDEGIDEARKIGLTDYFMKISRFPSELVNLIKEYIENPKRYMEKYDGLR